MTLTSRSFFFLALVLVACGKKSSDGASSAVVDAGEALPLDVAAYRNLAERPFRYREVRKSKIEGPVGRTTRTYFAPGLSKQEIDVTILEHKKTAWSLHFGQTKAVPSQFGKLTELFTRTIVGGTSTWYRIDDDALEGCFLLAQRPGTTTDITIDSIDFVAADNEPDEQALAEWIAVHLPDAGLDAGSADAGRK